MSSGGKISVEPLGGGLWRIAFLMGRSRRAGLSLSSSRGVLGGDVGSSELALKGSSQGTITPLPRDTADTKHDVGNPAMTAAWSGTPSHAWGRWFQLVIVRRRRGIPPHARGRPVRERPEPDFGGNTPACAGPTRGQPRRPPTRPEHPRMRGRQPRQHGIPVADRNTPAYAGPTGPGGQDAAVSGEHPRAGVFRPCPRPGLPPACRPRARARGRHLLHLGHQGYVRNTPACAGPTSPSTSSKPQHTEHPRVRGADGTMATPTTRTFGTPPRARGRRRRRPR